MGRGGGHALRQCLEKAARSRYLNGRDQACKCFRISLSTPPGSRNALCNDFKVTKEVGKYCFCLRDFVLLINIVSSEKEMMLFHCSKNSSVNIKTTMDVFACK